MADLENLVKVVNTGLDIPSFTEIREALITKYKAVYGSDIDLSSGTADGVFVYDIALLINNLCSALSSMYANLNANSAYGQYLDTICALGNIHRKAATASSTWLTLTVPTTSTFPVTFSASDVTFVDKSGKTWTTTTDMTFSSASANTIQVYVTCTETGPIAASAGWIYQTLAQHNPVITVSQPNDAEIGTNIESDEELRARRALANSSVGVTVEESLVGALLDIPAIKDIKLYVNNSDAAITSQSGISVPAHDMFILLRKLENIVVEDSTIGKIIANKLTPGVRTVANSTAAINHSYVYRPTDRSALYTTINWTECAGITPTCTMTISKLDGYNTDTETLIGNALIDYCNNLRFNQSHLATDLKYIATAVDPLYRNASTFTVSSITWSIAEFPDDFCKYTTATATTSGTTVTITLT